MESIFTTESSVLKSMFIVLHNRLAKISLDSFFLKTISKMLYYNTSKINSISEQVLFYYIALNLLFESSLNEVKKRIIIARNIYAKKLV